MTALPVAEFKRDVIDYSRDGGAATTRVKPRSNDIGARDQFEFDDRRADEASDFDKQLRAQESDSQPRAERTKETPVSEPVRNDRQDAAADSAEESTDSPKSASVKTKPTEEQAEPRPTNAKAAVLLADTVQVVSAAASKAPAETLEAAGVSAEPGAVDANAADPANTAQAVVAIAPTPTTPVRVPDSIGINTGTAVLQTSAAAMEAGASNPLGAPKDVKTGASSDALAAASAQLGAAAQPDIALQSAAAALSPGDKLDPKLRQSLEQGGNKPEAGAQTPAAAQSADSKSVTPPAAAIANAVKSAAAQGSKGLKAADPQGSEVKPLSAGLPSAFAAQLDSQLTQTATSPSATAQGGASPNATAIAQNVVRFFRETGAGNARFDIRLDPVELGRVDARVEINQDKTVTLTLSAERPETLAELMRTARDLERQLMESGLKLSEDGLKFRLNSDARGDAHQNMHGDSDGRRPARGAYASKADSALQAEAAIPIRSWRASGVDVWA